MIIHSASYSNLHYRFYKIIRPQGVEHRYCYSNDTMGHFGFATWLEHHSKGITRVTRYPEFFLTKTAAEALARERYEEARKICPPCSYHQVLVGKAEFAGSILKEQYETLQQWVMAQGIAKSDFAITVLRQHYRLSFRQINLTNKNAILFLKMYGVLSDSGHNNLITEHEGCLEDVRGYSGHR